MSLQGAKQTKINQNNIENKKRLEPVANAHAVNVRQCSRQLIHVQFD
jgi:hypothetical protein